MSEGPRDRFEEALRRWAEQPPRTSPDEAARQVVSRLDEPERAAHGRAWHPALAPALALAAVLMLALGLGWWARRTAVPAEPPAETASATLETATLPPLDDDVVLIWLDAETPLYLSLQTHETNSGDPT